MLSYIVRRLMWTPILLLFVSAIVFTLGHYGPGDPVQIQLGQHFTEERAERIRESRGLNDPVAQQYLRYVWNALQGDFGESTQFQGRGVTELLGPKLKVSAQLFLAAALITIGIGVPLGFYTALKQGSWQDPTIVSGSLVLDAMPVFLTAPFLIIIF
ncbi:MAG TPA: ABC transporter permease, partial [Dehalococcoidia bacterium]|nr:ABC transporter permease [Dehalococcoidia bacterium]